MEMQYFVDVVTKADKNKNNSAGRLRENGWSTFSLLVFFSVYAYET
jgi:hypothetical protein